MVRVVPLVGTWIEINEMLAFKDAAPVVPLVGTWIEIMEKPSHSSGSFCRSPRGNVD